MRFCFIIVAGGLLPAMVLRAADAPGQPRRITSVVRADPRSGRLVRSVVVTPKTVGERPVAQNVVAPRTAPVAAPEAPAEPPSGIDEAVERIAALHNLSPELLHSVIKVESNYDPYAISSKGALGLMQLIPATARRFGVGNVFNPIENIQGGARYLRYLLDLYGEQNYGLALAAYNAGEGAISKYGGVPPYRETQNYVLLVRREWEKANAAAARKPRPAPAPPAAPRDPSELNHIQQIVETDGTVRYVSR